MKMTFTDYENKIEELKTLPNVSISCGYGLTEADFIDLRNGGEKFVPFLMYLSTRPWYRLEPSERVEREFENEDAIPCAKCAEMIDELLYELVELVD